MDSAVLAARMLVAALFVIAAVTKLGDPAGTARAIVDFGGRRRYAPIGARLLPLLELSIAVALLIQPLAVAGAIAALAVLTVFTAAIVNALRHRRSPDCGCFGNLWSKPVSGWTVARNVGLLLVALFVALRGPGSAVPLWLGVVVLVAAGLFAVVAQRRTVSRSDSAGVERAVQSARAGIPVGTPAPAFSLEVACGGEGSLAALCGAGLPVVVMFLSSGCGACSELHPHLGRWQTTLADELTIAVIVAGNADAALRLCDEHGVSNVLIDNVDDPLWRAYRMPGTPSALAVAPDGTVASRAVLGADALEELVRQTIRRSAEADETWKQPSPLV